MTCSKFFLVLLMQVFILSSFANGNEITFSSLLQEMTNRESLVDYPSPYYTVRQFSSYDRFSDHAVKVLMTGLLIGILASFFVRKKRMDVGNLLCLTQKDLVL